MVDTVDTQNAVYTASVRDRDGTERVIADSAAFFREKGDHRSEAYCVARAIEFAVTRNSFAEAEALVRTAITTDDLSNQAAILAARGTFLSAIGQHSQALEAFLAAQGAPGRTPAQLHAQILGASIDAGRYSDAGLGRWSTWQRVSMVWHGHLGAVILGLAGQAQIMADAKPDEALRLAYLICRLPDRLAVQLSGAKYGLVSHLRAIQAKGIALDVVADIYRKLGRQEDAAAAFLDSHQAFLQAKKRVPAARALVLTFTCALVAGYSAPDEESHALDVIRAGLQVLEADRGKLRAEASRSGWLASQRELYAAVFGALSQVKYATAAAGELCLWLLESLHRTLTAGLIAADGTLAADPALLALLAELSERETRAQDDSADNALPLAEHQRQMEMLRELVRERLGQLQEASLVADPTDLQLALTRLGRRTAVLYHCWREEEAWVIHAVLVSHSHGIRIHQAELKVTDVEGAPWLTPVGALDALDAGDLSAIRRIFNNPLDDELWADIAKAILPSSWWEILCPADGERVDLLVVPDGPVASLPLAAMPVRAGKPLIEYATVALTPALSMLSDPETSTVGRPDRAPIAVVHLDDTDGGAPGAVLEAERWQSAAQHMQVIETSDQQSLEAALRRSPPPNLVAISVHGSGGSPAADSASRLFSSRVELRDGSILSASAALRLPWPETVILGACWVSGVSTHAGAEPFGFPIACLLRGATTVLGGVAPIPGAETARILGSIIDSLPFEAELLGTLRAAQQAELAAVPLSRITPAQIAGLVAWTIIPAPTYSPAAHLRARWGAGGLAPADVPTASYAPAVPLGEATERLLAIGQSLSGERPVGTLEFLAAALAADNADWRGFLGACGLGEPALPGGVDGPVEGSLLVEVPEREVTATRALVRALRRGQLVAEHMGDQLMLPSHVVLAALCDEDTAAGGWLRDSKRSATRDWRRHMADRIFWGDLPGSDVVLSIDHPAPPSQVHVSRFSGANLSEQAARNYGRRLRWITPVLVAALILAIPLLH